MRRRNGQQSKAQEIGQCLDPKPASEGSLSKAWPVSHRCPIKDSNNRVTLVESLRPTDYVWPASLLQCTDIGLGSNAKNRNEPLLVCWSVRTPCGWPATMTVTHQRFDLYFRVIFDGILTRISEFEIASSKTTFYKIFRLYPSEFDGLYCTSVQFSCSCNTIFAGRTPMRTLIEKIRFVLLHRTTVCTVRTSWEVAPKEAHRSSTMKGPTFTLVWLCLLGAGGAVAAATGAHHQSAYLKEILMGRCYDQPLLADGACASLVDSFLNVLESHRDADLEPDSFDAYLSKADALAASTVAVPKKDPPTLFHLRFYGDEASASLLFPGYQSPETTPGGSLLRDLLFCGVDQRNNCSVETSNAYWAFWQEGASRASRLRTWQWYF